MTNPIFEALLTLLAAHLGGSSPLESGNGARFTSARKGKVTIYHSNIAPGNQAEVAFDAGSMAVRLGMTQNEFGLFVAQLRALTERPVATNAQYSWPRVGAASEADVKLIGAALQKRFAAFAVP